MKKVVVVMSSYNGGKSIVKQLDSIFNQKGVEVICYIRDDGSEDNTPEILKKYSEKQPKLTIDYAENVGWQRSFLYALSMAPKGDYYAFSDQDDVWMSDKLIKSIEELEMHNNSKALLFHCNRISCNEKLEANFVQASKVSHPLSKENALTQEYAQGCSIVINQTAKNLVCRHIPTLRVPHDFWTGLICYYFGEVYYSSEPLFYHINHRNNASNAGHLRASQKSRFKSFLNATAYINVAKELLIGYSDLLNNKEKQFLEIAATNKSSTINRIKLVTNSKFCRVNLLGTILLKISVLLKKY